MPDDPTVQWSLASKFGIQVSADADAWHSGHATDVLQLPSGALVVAAQTGGVWTASAGSPALPLSDNWNNPDVNCLTQGPDDPAAHLFAGCTAGIIRETDPGAAAPLLTWEEIADPLPAGAGDV